MANSTRLKPKQIVVRMLEIITIGAVIIMCKRNFDNKIDFSEIGCDLINQKLLPSRDIDGAVMNTVELEKQNIKAIMPASISFGIIMPPSKEAIPFFPVTAMNIPITKIKITPIIVFIKYAGLDK